METEKFGGGGFVISRDKITSFTYTGKIRLIHNYYNSHIANISTHLFLILPVRHIAQWSPVRAGGGQGVRGPQAE